jgi:hypothetical protein
MTSEAHTPSTAMNITGAPICMRPSPAERIAVISCCAETRPKTSSTAVSRPNGSA